MKKKLFFKLFIFAVIGALVTVTSCKDYDDDINKLQTELNSLKSDVGTQLAALETKIKAEVDAKIATLNTEITALSGKITTLEGKLTTLEDGLAKAATKAELEAAKTEILSKTVALETFNAFKGQVETDIAAIKADLANAATKAELEAAIAGVTTKLGELQTALTEMGVRVTQLETDYAALLAKHDNDIKDVIAQIAALKGELEPRILSLEKILDMTEDGKRSKVLEDIYQKLDDQLDSIRANKAEIANVKKDLADKYAELVEVDKDLQKQITDNYNELDKRVKWNKDEILKLQDRMDAVEADIKNIKEVLLPELEARVNKRILNAYLSLDQRVTSMTFIPDYTSPDGTPQIVVRGITEWKYNKPANEGYYTPDWEDSEWDEYWSVLQKGKIYKGITILRYNVSPSNVKLSDFEIHALLHKTSLVRSADSKSAPIVLAGQATLANGVLSVPVMVEESDYDYEDGSWWWGLMSSRATSINDNDKWGSNVSVALQVKNINVEMDDDVNRYVTSTEYVKANFDLSEGRIALNEESMKDDGDLLPVGVEYDEIASASYASDIRLWNGKSQSGGMTDVLNHTINLNDYIYGVFDDHYDVWEKMTEFGFNNHTFKFKRVYLESEGVNQTNDYVTLNETTGVIGVKPDGNKVNQAAVGRTPIVEVTALVNGKVHAVGYIKIIITDGFDNSPVKFVFTLQDYVLGCNSTYKLTDVDIAEIDFDQVFNHARIQLGKDAFFAEYNQNPMVVTKVSPTPSAATVGYLGDGTHVEFGYSINPATQSVNLFNYIEAYITNDAPAGTYKVTTRLTSNGYRPDVVITWNFKVVLPTNLWLTPNNVFLSNGIYKLEPTVYGQTPTPKTSTPYEGLLQNAFLHNNNNLDLGAVAGQNCETFLTPYFVFTKVPAGFRIHQLPQSPQTETGVFEVRKGGTGAGGDLAATIYYFQTGDANPKNYFTDKGFYIVLNTQNDAGGSSQVGNYTPYTQAAIDLVKAGWVEVQPRGYINGQPLNWVNLYDPFTIQITYPVKFNFADKYEVWDQGTGAKQQVSIWTIPNGIPQNNNIVIKDFLNNDIRFGYTAQERTTGLINHYELDYVTGGLLNFSWAPNVLFDVNNVTTSLPGGQLPFGMTLKVDPSSTHGLHVYKWENATGGSVQNAFEIYIPASIKHKWGTLETLVTVVVNPGTGN